MVGSKPGRGSEGFGVRPLFRQASLSFQGATLSSKIHTAQDNVFIVSFPRQTADTSQAATMYRTQGAYTGIPIPRKPHHRIVNTYSLADQTMTDLVSCTYRGYRLHEGTGTADLYILGP